ncbi:hypothetical protein DFJ73DRAFT_834878, partial [Zopfochytrium polystomum]
VEAAATPLRRKQPSRHHHRQRNRRGPQLGDVDAHPGPDLHLDTYPGRPSPPNAINMSPSAGPNLQPAPAPASFSLFTIQMTGRPVGERLLIVAPASAAKGLHLHPDRLLVGKRRPAGARPDLQQTDEGIDIGSTSQGFGRKWCHVPRHDSCSVASSATLAWSSASSTSTLDSPPHSHPVANSRTPPLPTATSSSSSSFNSNPEKDYVRSLPPWAPTAPPRAQAANTAAAGTKEALARDVPAEESLRLRSEQASSAGPMMSVASTASSAAAAPNQMVVASASRQTPPPSPKRAPPSRAKSVPRSLFRSSAPPPVTPTTSTRPLFRVASPQPSRSASFPYSSSPIPQDTNAIRPATQRESPCQPRALSPPPDVRTAPRKSADATTARKGLFAFFHR